MFTIICHPGYDYDAPFLTFEHLDLGSGDTGKRGVPHQVVFNACRIVANDEDGFLSTTKGSADKVLLETTILFEGAY